jgi:hypothetical protein
MRTSPRLNGIDILDYASLWRFKSDELQCLQGLLQRSFGLLPKAGNPIS